MARYYQRPENALKRANEFIEVGKPNRALDTLYEVIRSKKHRAGNYSEKVLEPIMFKYLTLCVDLKKSHIAKEGLFQYRNICQVVNVASLEHVVRSYLQMAEERTEAARERSHQAVVDIDDLDQLQTPESLLLSAVSGEDVQDRTDRTILTPWVKFLWESYRQCLELLRINPRVERLYHDIAQQAFKFCLKYQRKTEFRKLSDNLRNHLNIIQKQQLAGSTSGINLNNPDTQQMNLETRLAQLEAAIQMELWQEAYKAIDDIHKLMQLSKKPAKPQMLANYYHKIALVFWKAGNQLFHAAALYKLFQLSKEMKRNMTPAELQKMASQLLMATLGVPFPTNHPEFGRFIETEKSSSDKVQSLATLLSMTSPPTRVSLIKDLSRLNVVQYVSPELQNLFNWLEVDFLPLDLCSRVKKMCEGIGQNAEFSYLHQYIPNIEEVALMRLVKQVAQVYQTIEVKRLLELSYFATKFQIERVIVDAARHNDMQVRLDHKMGCVHFGTDLSECQREDLLEGPMVQSMPTEHIRTQLISISKALSASVALIQPDKQTKQRESLRKMITASYEKNKHANRQRIMSRHKIIEERKEMLETITQQRAEEERRAADEQLKKHQAAEQQRLIKEVEEREEKRHNEEIREITMRHVKEKIDNLSRTAIGKRIISKIDEEELYKLDADAILQRQKEEIEKEQQELLQKQKSQAKKMDYIERAKRIEEIPLLQAAYEEEKVVDEKYWEETEKTRIEEMNEERRNALSTQSRLAKMIKDKDLFVKKIRTERGTLFQDKLNEFNQTLTAERKKRLAERRELRYKERKEKWLEEKEEEERRQREEEAKREMEQQLERDRKERERLDALAAKQMQREKEIEAKLRAKEEAERADKERQTRDRDRVKEPPPRESDWRHGESGDGKTEPWRPKSSWREREAKQEEEKWGPRRDAPRSVGGRDERFPPRDRDDGPPKRDDVWRASKRDEDRSTGGAWRESGKEPWRPPARDDRPPPRDLGRDGPRDSKPPPRDFGRDDRRPPPRDFGRDERSRDFGRDDRGPSRDFGRDDRGPSRDFGRDDRGPSRDFGRDDRRAPFRDFGRDSRDSRGPPPRGRDEPSDWRSKRDEGRDGKDRDWGRGPRDVRRDDPPARREDQRDDDGWTKVKK